MNRRNEKGKRRSVFDINPEEIDEEIYGQVGTSDISDTRVVARPIDIFDIRADATQPRDAVPPSVAEAWDGSAADVPDLLADWHKKAGTAVKSWYEALPSETDEQLDYKHEIDLTNLLLNVQQYVNGHWPGIDVNGDMPVIYQSYIAMVQLAKSIYQNGLVNPITTRNEMIVAGERRWLSFHLLNLFFDGYSRIPAIQSDAGYYESVKLQATENMDRRDLNAISIAKQFAKMLMAAREKEADENYLTLEEILAQGLPKRRWFAQVADGHKHRIPRGMSDELRDVLKISPQQMRQYRNLLSMTGDEEVDDILWDAAAENDWPEYTMRQLTQELTVDEIHQVVGGDDWTLQTLKQAAEDKKEVKNSQKQPDTVTPVTVSGRNDANKQSDHYARPEWIREMHGKSVRLIDGRVGGVSMTRRDPSGKWKAFVKLADGGGWVLVEEIEQVLETVQRVTPPRPEFEPRTPQVSRTERDYGDLTGRWIRVNSRVLYVESHEGDKITATVDRTGQTMHLRRENIEAVDVNPVTGKAHPDNEFASDNSDSQGQAETDNTPNFTTVKASELVGQPVQLQDGRPGVIVASVNGQVRVQLNNGDRPLFDVNVLTYDDDRLNDTVLTVVGGGGGDNTPTNHNPTIVDEKDCYIIATLCDMAEALDMKPEADNLRWLMHQRSGNLPEDTQEKINSAEAAQIAILEFLNSALNDVHNKIETDSRLND